jgi:hypothetical protein
MTLNALKDSLISAIGSDVKEVLFDFQEYLNDAHKKVYPTVIWTINGGEFTKDIRPNTFAPKEITLSVFIIQKIDSTVEDNLSVWDSVEEVFDAYLMSVNALSTISIEGIDKMKGVYYPEGLIDTDSEVGIGYKVTLKMFC